MAINVKKDVSDNSEEKTILYNIVSLAQQLLQAENAEGTKEENVQTGEELEPKENVQMADDGKEDKDEKDEDKEEGKEVKKGIIETGSDGATANDTSEKKLDDPLTDITEETIDEVAKAIVEKLYKSKSVKKSVNEDNGTVNKLLTEMLKIQKGLLARQEETENAIANLIKGFGIADQVTKAYQAETNKQVKKGLNDPQDVENTLRFIAKALNLDTQKKEESKSDSNSDIVRKSLADKGLLTALTKYRL